MRFFFTNKSAYLFLMASLGMISSASGAGAPGVSYSGPAGDGAFIVPRLRAALETEAWSAVEVILEIDAALPAEGYRVQRSHADGRISIRGADRRGLIYGGQDLIDQIRHGALPATVLDRSEAPCVVFRALKFNLPWDSYRRGSPLQQHIDTCKDPAFWERLLDMLSENRFNALTLWNLHPFDTMIQARNFPEAHTFKGEEMDQWRLLFRTIFALARERGIETYIVTWNIFVPDGFAQKHGVALDEPRSDYIGGGDPAQIIKDYTRECVTQVIEEYPDLTGIGFSLGERMGGFTVAEREQWILDTYVEGAKAASRPIKLIHRAPFSADLASEGSMDHKTEVLTRQAIEGISGTETPVWVEVKFNWSHAHSTPRLVKTHGGPIHDVYWNPTPKNYRIAWMMRNEDFHCLRWGTADFIREHIALNNHDYSGGYFVGSECYIPALDYFTKLPGATWDYAFERQWLFYMLWGRLLYNPATPDAQFADEFVARYGPEARVLLAAYAKASTMPLRFISAFDITWDYTMHAETFSAFLGAETRTRPFITIDALIKQPPLDPNYVGIADFVKRRRAGEKFAPSQMTPLRLADTVEHDMRSALSEVAGLAPTEVAFRYEVADVQAWSYLGLYYAEKVRAGVALESFRASGEADQKETALAHIRAAMGWWDKLVALTEPLYRPFPTMVYLAHPEPLFHWANIRDEVAQDLEIIEQAEARK